MMKYISDNIISSIISLAVSFVLTRFWTNREYILLWLKIYFGGARKDRVRFSVAYLFRIKIDGKYLLVKNSKINNQYQPIGGVYKKYKSFDEIANKLGVLEEKTQNFRVTDDLRVYVKSENTIAFLKWIKTRLNREVNVIREFIEEIVQKGVTPADSLKDIQFEFIKTYDSGLHYTRQFSSYEILVHDIFEVRLDNISEEKLKEFIDSDSDNYLILVEQTDISKMAITIDGVDYRIGEQTINIL